jgi:hypothetical protein
MAHFATELSPTPPKGYPTGAYGPPVAGKPQPIAGTVYYPNAPLPASTANPHGVANSPDEYHNPAQAGDSYGFFTREQKIVVTGAAVSTPYDAEGEGGLPEENPAVPWEPYPEGNPIDEARAFEMLTRCHPPMNLVPSDEYQSAAEKNLRAGGSMELDQVRELRTGL